MQQPPTRQLAIILHADIIGSTTLVQIDESIAHQRMQSAFRDFSKIISQYAGITHELRGDALVAQFERASDAVSASLFFQHQNLQTNTHYDDSIKPIIRIGIAIGEVVIADKTITGTGVILAQRLEQLAEPSGTVIQGAAYETIPKRLPFIFTSLGQQQLKGFESPVSAYTASIDCLSEIPTAESVVKTSNDKPIQLSKPAIAILPFKNMSNDPEQEYFSDGISEDIITALSYFRSFPVISRNSSFHYKNQTLSNQEIAKELNAKYIVEGGVRKSANRLRITARLVDADSGHQLWSSKFDRTIDDIFDIQDEISEKIVTMIQPELTLSELKKVEGTRPENLTAWDLFIRGMSHMNNFTKDEVQKAAVFFNQALELDPDYSDAWSGLAWSQLFEVFITSPSDRQPLIDQGTVSAQKAVLLDNSSSIAHYVLGISYVWNEDFDSAIREGELAIELNPYNATAHMGLGNRLDLVGRTEEGIEKLEYALKFNPRDPRRGLCLALLSRANASIKNYDKALLWAKEAVAVSADGPDFQYRLAISFANVDHIAEAQACLAKCEQLQPDFIKEREQWLPYSDPEQNKNFFQGAWNHGLLKPYQ